MAVCAATVLMTACSPSAHEQAMSYIGRAKAAMNEGDTAAAQLLADTVHAVFPKEIAARRCADTITWRIEYSRLLRLLPTMANQLRISDSLFNAVSPKFKFYKDEKYEDIGHFEHRLLVTEKGVGRCYLKPTVDEHGVVSVTSHYIGAKASHTGFSVSADDIGISADTDTDISSFDDEGTFHEIMTPSADRSLDIVRFVSENADNKVKVSLLGKPYFYYLNASEKTAFRETFVLHQALNNIHKLNDSELRAQQKLEILKRKLSIDQ